MGKFQWPVAERRSQCVGLVSGHDMNMTDPGGERSIDHVGSQRLAGQGQKQLVQRTGSTRQPGSQYHGIDPLTHLQSDWSVS